MREDFDKCMLAELVSRRFLEANKLAVLGPVGVGKTFVSQALHKESQAW